MRRISPIQLLTRVIFLTNIVIGCIKLLVAEEGWKMPLLHMFTFDNLTWFFIILLFAFMVTLLIREELLFRVRSQRTPSGVSHDTPADDSWLVYGVKHFRPPFNVQSKENYQKFLHTSARASIGELWAQAQERDLSSEEMCTAIELYECLGPACKHSYKGFRDRCQYVLQGIDLTETWDERETDDRVPQQQGSGINTTREAISNFCHYEF